MARTRLTEQQMRTFETFGFLAFAGLLADCIDEIVEEFEAVWRRHGGGHHGRPHDGERRSCLVPFIDQSERLSALIDDPRIHDIVTSLLGEDFNYAGSDGNYYAGDTRWHSDGWNPGRPMSIKLALYLDPLTRDTGALRVIPGSQRAGEPYADLLQERVGDSAAEWGLDGRDLPALALETRPGDVLCFNHNTKHAAFGGGGRRRMFTINCHRRYPEERLDELRQHVSSFAPLLERARLRPRHGAQRRPGTDGAPGADTGQRRPPGRAFAAAARGDERAVTRLTDCQKRRRGTIMGASGRDRVPLEDVIQ